MVLKKQAGRGPVYSIALRGSGAIDGEVTISLMLNGSVYKVEHLTGTVSFVWAGDWYSDTAGVRYEPKAVMSGKVVLEYAFHTLESESAINALQRTASLSLGRR